MLKTLKMKIVIGSDHAGYELKSHIIKHLLNLGHEVFNKGTNSSESTDYPEYAHAVSNSVENGNCDFGIVICGSGNGVAITANKHQGIRAAVSWIPEIAKLARAHNDANVLSLPARFVTFEQAVEIVDVFLNSSFEGGRHKRRVDKISVL